MAKGQHAQACPKFVESYRLDPALGSLLNAATCHKAEGKTATAWSEFRDAEQQAHRAGDAKRQKFAASKAAEIEPTLPKLIITLLERPAGTKVSRDGLPLGDASLNTPLPVDPGEHTIRVEAPGFVTWETTVEAFAAKRASVVVPELDRAPVTQTAGGGGRGDARGAGDAGDAGDPPTGSGHDYRTAGLIIGGVGAASVAVGAIFAGMYFSAAGECEGASREENCPREDPLRDQMKTRGTISGITLVAGGAAVVAGAILYLTSTPRDEAQAGAEGAWVAPRLAPGGLGIDGGFSF
ncbi:MAG: PEGA domain-containing protein [Polyangiaceae bacterium]